MRKKSILLLVFALAGILLVMFIVNMNRESDIYKELKNLSSQNVTSLFLDPEGFASQIPITHPQDIESLLICLKKMSPSQKQLKNYQAIDRFTLNLNLKTSEEYSLVIKIIKTDELGDKALISIQKKVALGTVPAGIYESDDILSWVNELTHK